MTRSKSFDSRILHLCIMAIIILGFGYLPTFSTVTPYGMKAIGCFLGIIYGWIFVDMLWTALAVFILVPFTGLQTADGLITAGFGNVIVMQVCFILMLFSVLSTTEIPRKITNYLLSLKICLGKPWVFFAVLMLATWIVSFLAGGVVGLLILFEIVITLCKDYGIERYTKTSTFLFMGILLADCLGQMCLPVKGMPLILMAMYKAMDPSIVFPTVTYMLFSTIFTLFICVLSLLLMKYLFRVDLSVLNNIDAETFAKFDSRWTKREKIVFIDIVIVLVLMILQTAIPEGTIRNFLGEFGTIGFCFIGMLALLLIKVDKKPIARMSEMASGMSWDTLLTVAAMQPVLGFVSSEDSGISAMLEDLCGPIVAELSPLLFTVVICVICGFLTNFLNNAACCLMFFPLIMIYAPELGLSAVGLVVLLIIISHCAFATPAASFYSLIAFGYTDWISAKQFMKYALLLLIPLVIIMSFAGYFLQILFF